MLIGAIEAERRLQVVRPAVAVHDVHAIGLIRIGRRRERLHRRSGRHVRDRRAVQAGAGVEVRDVADDEAAGAGHAARLADHDVVHLPPPRPEGVVVVPTDLHVALTSRDPGDVDVHLVGTTVVRGLLEDVRPRRPAVRADVDVGRVTEVEVILIEADDRGRRRREVDARREQRRIVEAAGAVAVAVDQGERTRATGQVAVEVAARRIRDDLPTRSRRFRFRCPASPEATRRRRRTRRVRRGPGSGPGRCRRARRH